MSSSNGAEETLTPPSEQQANALEATAMDAKLMVATASGDVQQLKDLVKHEESQMMVVVMAKQSAPTRKPHQGNINPHLLKLASSGSFEKLQTLLDGEDNQASINGGTDRRLPIRRASDEDTEANESILAGVTAEGDTALHVVAACGQGDKFFTRFREAKHLLVQHKKTMKKKKNNDNADTDVDANNNKDDANNNDDDDENNKKTNKGWRWQWRWWLTRAERHALTTYGDGDNFLESSHTIYRKAKHLLFMPNNNGDTPLHCAARAGKSNMVQCLINLAGEGRVKELLRMENKHKETALHEAVRVGNKDIVDLLMGKDSELASFPQDGGVSPMYLAITLKQDLIEATLYEKSRGKLSFSGPNGQNALHAAVRRCHGTGLKKLLEWNATKQCPQNKDLTTQSDENGSTPLHFAAAHKLRFGPSIGCRQVLEANPDALYQPDHAGFFPIHVAASVGAFWNVCMFVRKYPGSAGLRDAKGRTFLHVAVEKKKVSVISSACRNLSLSWIMNMVDNDGNTAFHLAVEAGSLQMFCPLVGNPQVNLNLPNNRGETPLDIAGYKIPENALYDNQSSEAQICGTLRLFGAMNGVHRWDHLLEDNKTVRVKARAESKADVLKDMNGALCIVSVLITTVTFGATFATPGGYIADDHSNGGSPILSRRYAFDAFIASNTMAFVFSTMATCGLMLSGIPLRNQLSRMLHLGIAYNLVSFSITCLTAAFALGAYVVLAPVAHKTAVATCVLTSLVLLYNRIEYIWRRLLLLPPLCKRKGLIFAWVVSLMNIITNLVFENCQFILIFGWAVYANRSPKILEPAQAPAPAPAPLA